MNFYDQQITGFCNWEPSFDQKTFQELSPLKSKY